MKGLMLVYEAFGALDSPPDHVIELTAPPMVETMHRYVGGYLEAVPHFDSVMHGAALHRCVAFCNEDGKGENLAVNRRATVLWEAALQRRGRSLLNARGEVMDYLVGTIVIIIGDRQLLRNL